MTNQEIKQFIYDREVQIHEVRSKCDEDIKLIRKAINEVRKQCKHESGTYVPDPSGNNDSYYYCDYCGKEY